jgi:hypothetical protein
MLVTQRLGFAAETWLTLEPPFSHKPRVGRGRGNRSVFSFIFLALELLEI